MAFLCARPGGSVINQTVPKEVLTSTNGGRTVHLTGPAPANGTPEGFASPPGNPAVITITAGGTEFDRDYWIYRSVNDGKTWTTQVIHGDTIETFNSLIFTNRTTGWITLGGQGENFEGTLLHTTDSGRTWHKTTPRTPPLSAAATEPAHPRRTCLPCRTHRNGPGHPGLRLLPQQPARAGQEIASRSTVAGPGRRRSGALLSGCVHAAVPGSHVTLQGRWPLCCI